MNGRLRVKLCLKSSCAIAGACGFILHARVPAEDRAAVHPAARGGHVAGAGSGASEITGR